MTDIRKPCSSLWRAESTSCSVSSVFSLSARSSSVSAISSLHPFGLVSDGRSAPAPVKAIPQPRRVFHPFSQRSVGPCRGGSRPDREGAQGAAGQGEPRRSLWRRACALNARIETCWLGDLLATIGFVALAALIFIFFGVL